MIINREIPLNIARPNSPVIARVVESVALTGTKSATHCRHIVFDISGSQMEHQFEAGQAFGIIPEWPVKPDDHTLRLYSIASPSAGENGDGKTLATTVKRVVGEDDETHHLFLGTASNYLCDLQVGDTVKLTGPTGKQMLLPDWEHRNNHNYVFIATGTGIAPFRGMLIELLESGYSGEVHLIFGVPYSTDIYYETLFRRYEEKYPNVHFYTAISREQGENGESGMYVQDRLTVDWDQVAETLTNSNTLLYLCGNSGMEWEIYQLLVEKGCYGYFKSVPEPLISPADHPEANEQELIRELIPNHDRLRLEVY